MSIAIIIPVDGTPIVSAIQRNSNENLLHLVDAREITTLGAATAAELVNGPLSETEVGPQLPPMFVPFSQIKCFFPVADGAGWEF